MRKVRTFILATALLAVPAKAQWSLDQLSACDDLARAYAAIRAPPGRCRAPGNAVESALAQRMAGWHRASRCLLAEAPAPSLSRFGCFHVVLPNTRHLDCVAPAERVEVERYKANPEAHTARVSAYLRAAGSCPVGNGIASVMTHRSMLSTILGMVAEFDLGFAMQVGGAEVRGALVGNGVITHGFARVDPAIAGREDAELEFVSIIHVDRGD